MHLDCKMWTCDTSFETLVACEAHDLWRRQRKFKASVKTHGDTTVDTAACEFLDLPSYSNSIHSWVLTAFVRLYGMLGGRQ